MKKAYLQQAAMAVLLLFVAAMAVAEQPTRIPNGVGLCSYAQQVAAGVTISTGEFYVQGGICNEMYPYENLPAADSDTLCGVTILMGSATLASGYCVVAGSITQSLVYPRTLRIGFDTGTGTNTIAGTCRIWGKDSLGLDRIETVTISNAAVYHSSYCYAYVYSSTYTITAADADVGTGKASWGGGETGLTGIRMGIGTKVGVPNAILATTDMIYGSNAGTAMTAAQCAAACNATYNSVEPTTAANGTYDYYYTFKVRKLKKS